MEKKKILIDTDIGDDVDDALAIALALKSPELELLGITTVFKNTKQRTQLALKLLSLLGKLKVPVATGIANPIRHEVTPFVEPYQCRVLTEELPMNCTLSAVDLILSTVKRHPDVTIVGIGAFTNIAIAFLLEPELMRDIHIVLMGGAFGSVYPEWNILCDPEAANIILKFSANVEMVGLDATVHCVLPKDDLDFIAKCEGKAESFIGDMVDVWMDTSSGKKVTLHDPLTVAYLIDPSLLTMKMAPVAVELEGTIARASTVVLSTPFHKRGVANIADNVNIAIGVDVERTRRLVMERVFGRTKF